MSRQTEGLRVPAVGQAEQVPATSRRRSLYRACNRDQRQPWWYSSRDLADDPGRFDLLAPQGTCYWALDPSTAIIEVTSDPDQIDPPVLTIGALERLAVWTAEHVPAARSRLANVTVASVPGLTKEISTSADFRTPWAWADEFQRVGRTGILYDARFGMSEAVALFGPAGRPHEPPDAHRATAVSHLDDLPHAFRAGIGSVGTLAQLPKAPAP